MRSAKCNGTATVSEYSIEETLNFYRTSKPFITSFDDIDFDFIDFSIKRDDYAKRLLAETGTEITKVYPEIKTFESAIEICYDAFEKFMMYGRDKRTIDAIVEFKIACWKKADQVTKKNRFFK